jgi:hypothetical protein
MKIERSLLAGLLLVGCVGASVLAAEDAVSGQPSDIDASSETSQANSTLRRLGLALASGKEAIRSFSGSPTGSQSQKDKLSPPIAGLDCSIDRIASYVSCYGALFNTEEEALTLFTRLVDELQAALPGRGGSEQQRSRERLRFDAISMRIEILVRISIST